MRRGERQVVSGRALLVFEIKAACLRAKRFAADVHSGVSRWPLTGHAAKMAELEAFERAIQTFGNKEFATSLQLFEGIAGRNGKDLPAEYYRKRAAAEASA